MQELMEFEPVDFSKDSGALVKRTIRKGRFFISHPYSPSVLLPILIIDAYDVQELCEDSSMVQMI